MAAASDAGSARGAGEGRAGVGGAGGSTTTTTNDPCLALNCQAPQVCGGGCATDGTVGCYTPGGSLDAGHWDCPSCFPMFQNNDKACGKEPAYPYAYFCQEGSQFLDGCDQSASVALYICCPAGPDGGAP